MAVPLVIALANGFGAELAEESLKKNFIKFILFCFGFYGAGCSNSVCGFIYKKGCFNRFCQYAYFIHIFLL